VLAALGILAWVVVQYWLTGWIEERGWWQGLAWLGGVIAFAVALLLAWFLFFPVMNLFAPMFLDPICMEVYRRKTGRELQGRLGAASYFKRRGLQPCSQPRFSQLRHVWNCRWRCLR
jgi:uncharacterized protein involved in cysteine biosynthesis